MNFTALASKDFSKVICDTTLSSTITAHVGTP